MAFPSHLDITFAVGTSLLVISPLFFDVDPARQDSEVVYCEVIFTAPICKGSVHDVFLPEDFRNLASALTKMMNGEAATVVVLGLESWFRLDGAWNAEERVAGFKISMPDRLGLEDWCSWHKSSQYREGMKTSIELEFWMEPAALEEPLVELETVREHIKALREAFREQDHSFDPDTNL